MPYENLPRLPDPTTTPAGPGFLSAGYSDTPAGMVHQLNTGGTVSVQYAGSAWSFNIAYPELTIQEGNTLYPWLVSFGGGFKNFYIQLPMFINPATGAWDTSTPAKIAQGAISLGATDRNVTISNWSSRGGNLSPGDMLKFTNSNKIYQVVSTLVISNVMILELNCPIAEPLKIPGGALEPNSIKFRVRLIGSAPTMEFTNKGLYAPVSISLRENII